jgi:hypothetical protein
MYNSGFTYHELFHTGSENSTVIKAGEFIDNLKSMNYIGFNGSASLFSINMNKDTYTAGFSINDRAVFQFGYPQDFLKLLWYGNGAYIGKTLEIGNFSLDATWYREYALHATKRYKKWNFGASPKLLYGKTNIHTKASSIKLYTDTGIYALTANADIQLQTSGIPDSTDNSLGYLNTSEKVNEYAFNKQNKGIAIDLGASYEYNDRLSFAAGINNLGYINWKSNIHNYSSGNKSFTFDGLAASGFFQGDSSVISVDKWTDTVKDFIEFNKSKESYKTALPTEFYLMGNYIINKHHFGVQLAGQRFNKKLLYSATLCYQIQLGKHFTGALSYTAKKQAPANLGGAIILQFLHMQWYFVTDNWYAAIKPLDSKNMNLHMGMNLVFGAKKAKDKEEVFR